MNSRIANVIGWPLLHAGVWVCLLTVLTSHAMAQTPGAAAPSTTVPSAAPQAPSPAGQPATPPPAGTAAPTAPTESPEAVNARRTQCEQFSAFLAGRRDDPALAENPELQAFAPRVRDLVICGAIATDSDAHCNLLGKGDSQSRDDCLTQRGVFHELSAYPNGRSSFIPDFNYRECQKSPFAAICDGLRDALRSGDANQCVLQADFQAMCRKAITEPELTDAQCRVMAPELRRGWEARCRAFITGKKSDCHVDTPTTGQMAKERASLTKEMEKECTTKLQEGAAYKPGLKALAESGSEREREFAKAALHQPEACQRYVEASTDACSRGPNAGSPENVIPPAKSATPKPTNPTQKSRPGTAPRPKPTP